MARGIVLEEFHLTATVGPRTRDPVREAARRALTGRRFQAALRAAISKVRNRLRASSAALDFAFITESRNFFGRL